MSGEVVEIPTARRSRTVADERKRLLRAQARRAELRASRESGDLVSLVAVERLVSAKVVAARDRLLSIPSKLRQRFPDLEPALLAEVDRLIREALEELAEAREGAAEAGRMTGGQRRRRKDRRSTRKAGQPTGTRPTTAPATSPSVDDGGAA